jgi:hypothetical protein
MRFSDDRSPVNRGVVDQAVVAAAREVGAIIADHVEMTERDRRR